MRSFVLVTTACLILSACSSRLVRPSDDLWDGEAGTDAAAFLGYHGRVEQGADRPEN